MYLKIKSELDLWIDLVQEDYPGLNHSQYDTMRHIAAIYYYFGDGDPLWSHGYNMANAEEYTKLYERFLVIKELTKQQSEEHE